MTAIANQNKNDSSRVFDMTKWDNRPTAKARKMLIAGVAYRDIAEETGMEIQSIRSIASCMRKAGMEIPIMQKRYEYTGVNKAGQVVTFSSLSECAAQGFKGEYVSQCVNGHRERYVGYTWSRREVS